MAPYENKKVWIRLKTIQFKQSSKLGLYGENIYVVNIIDNLGFGVVGLKSAAELKRDVLDELNYTTINIDKDLLPKQIYGAILSIIIDKLVLGSSPRQRNVLFYNPSQNPQFYTIFNSYGKRDIIIPVDKIIQEKNIWHGNEYPTLVLDTDRWSPMVEYPGSNDPFMNDMRMTNLIYFLFSVDDDLLAEIATSSSDFSCHNSYYIRIINLINGEVVNTTVLNDIMPLAISHTHIIGIDKRSRQFYVVNYTVNQSVVTYNMPDDVTQLEKIIPLANNSYLSVYYPYNITKYTAEG